MSTFVSSVSFSGPQLPLPAGWGAEETFELRFQTAATMVTGTAMTRIARVATTVRRLRYFAASRRRRLGPIDVVPWEWSNFLRSCVRGRGQIAYNPKRSDREPSTRRDDASIAPCPVAPLGPSDWSAKHPGLC